MFEWKDAVSGEVCKSCGSNIKVNVMHFNDKPTESVLCETCIESSIKRYESKNK